MLSAGAMQNKITEVAGGWGFSAPAYEHRLAGAL